jgi:hypothetical protein
VEDVVKFVGLEGLFMVLMFWIKYVKVGIFV